ncbi:MAG: DUF1501 domain-containing protein [Planctomycetota bacterium]|nr:DUF1501 domain-containing protein [Planctomycetota bacterium]
MSFFFWIDMNEYTGPTRREWLSRAAGGLGGVALSGLLAGQSAQAAQGNGLHFPAKAKRVIFLYMTGGVSHVESFDYKAALYRDHGKTISVDNWQGKPGSYSPYLKAPNWGFRPGGQNGTMVSDLFPQVRSMVDEIAVIRSMHTEHANHYESTLGMHCGSWTFARPSMGSWMTYGLGTENQDLPGFVVVAPAEPYAGAQTWASDFLPGTYQGTRIRPGRDPIPNLKPRVTGGQLQRIELEFLGEANRRHLRERAGDRQLEGVIRAFETAYGMQQAAPGLFDLTRESPATLDLYGVQPGESVGFGWQCLIARRLAELGVRFVELIDTGSSGNWDSHANMQDHVARAANVDRPIAAMLQDLNQRGMLDETLVVWTTEFGRTPYHEEANHPGREHHRHVFSSWLAGGGVRAGSVYGASDEYGMKVAENGVHVHDFHATILALMGIDHERLTYRHAGRDYRLTDVHGDVVEDLFA